jgi:hypothetical protein
MQRPSVDVRIEAVAGDGVLGGEPADRVRGGQRGVGEDIGAPILGHGGGSPSEREQEQTDPQCDPVATHQAIAPSSARGLVSRVSRMCG